MQMNWLVAASLAVVAGALVQGRPNAIPGPAASTPLPAPAAPTPGPTLTFEENRGAFAQGVLFHAKGRGYDVALRREGAEIRMGGRAARPIRLEFLGASPAPRVTGEATSGRVHRYLGAAASRWSADARRVDRVRYSAVYPGIDAVYYGRGAAVEYDFEVAPGARPSAIALRLAGADRVELQASGDLLVHAGGTRLVQKRPVAYQRIAGREVPVAARYRMDGARIGIEVGRYDARHPLVIDPVITASSMLGTPGQDVARASAIDAAGNLYVAGSSCGDGFPQAGGTSARAGGCDVVVSKFDPSGTRLLYSTYLGGRMDDEATGIAVDAAGNAYVVGNTLSPDFPVPSALQAAPKSDRIEGFVAKLDGAGRLVYGTYLGGSDIDILRAIAVDAAGDMYVAGHTYSTDFPLTAGALRRTLQASEITVTRIAASGQVLKYSTFVGGDNVDADARLAIDASGHAYVAGTTLSRDFPAVNAYQAEAPRSAGSYSRFGYGWDTVVFVLAPDGASLRSSTYLAGSYADFPNAIVVDAQGVIHVAGEAEWQAMDMNAWNGWIEFPREQAFQSTYGGGKTDGYVARLDPSGSRLLYSTYLGGGADERLTALALDAAGRTYVAGHLGFLDARFPLVAPLQSTLRGQDAYLLRLAADGKSVTFGTLLGGAGYEEAWALSVDPAGVAWVSGATFSSDYPHVRGVTHGHEDGWDLFATRISPAARAVADANADRRADIAWHHDTTGQFDLWSMEGTARLGVSTWHVDPRYTVAGTGDFNGDGRMDLLWNDRQRTQLWMWLSDASGYRVEFVRDHPPAGWSIAGIGDVDADGRADILWHDPARQQLDWWSMHGAAIRAYGAKAVPERYRVASVADFDADGRVDVLWADTQRTELWMWLARSGDFAVRWVRPHPPADWAVAAAGDVDGDGTADILWQSTTQQQLNWWTMSGETLRGIGAQSVPGQYRIAAVGDYDADGSADLLWRDTAGTELWQWRPGLQGQFAVAWLGAHPPAGWSVVSSRHQ